MRIHTGAGIESTSPETARYNVSWGFAVEVLPSRVTILASDALKPEEIDVSKRAQQQLEQGQQMWKEAGDSEGCPYIEALRVISEAEAKIASAAETTKHTPDFRSASHGTKSPARELGFLKWPSYQTPWCADVAWRHLHQTRPRAEAGWVSGAGHDKVVCDTWVAEIHHARRSQTCCIH